ncbi:MAG TPA: class I SAM-dependent methyltransferase [Polyangiaceae bacterium]|nr:class I SAM-dependent methyltransferase [Polyangiaceae bacterium]
MVAACRAVETELDDAFARDPFAARLAGDRGFAILNALPNAHMMRFGLAIRTCVLDDLLHEALAAHPIATVLSVGCGLDTRPWRLDLPPALRWVEADFTDMLGYKHNLMADEKPRCHVERLAVDLNDEAQRQRLYAAAGSGPALMITEGLLLYLPAATVEAVAAECGPRAGVTHWISDISTTAFNQAITGSSRVQSISHVQAADALPGEEMLKVFHRNGWRTGSWRSYLNDLGFARDRIRRVMGDEPPPAAAKLPPDDPTGVHCFTRES